MNYHNLAKVKGYGIELLENKFLSLKLDVNEDVLLKVKSAIVYLSRYFDEIEYLINEANLDYLKILNSATVKEERG